jgi:acetyl esterase/lipase
MRVLVVPGAAVDRYVRPAVDALRADGVDASLLGAPGAPGVPSDLRTYGLELAHRMADGPATDLLVGLSVGAQAAAVAAATSEASRVLQLVLVSPTVDPAARNGPRLLLRWLLAGRLEPLQLGVDQAPDWARTGVRRLVGVVRSALATPIEELLPDVTSRLTVIHAERDAITSHAYAARLAGRDSGRLLIVPGATHSWPYRDEDRFTDTIAKLTA